MRIYPGLTLLVFVSILASASLHAQSGGVAILQPEPLYDEGLQSYFSHTFKSVVDRKTGSDTALNPNNLGLREHLWATGLNYGLSDSLFGGVIRDVTVAANVPLYYRLFRTSAGGTVVDDELVGLGDVGAFARFRYLWLAPQDNSGEAHHFSLVAGVEAPTGTWDIEKNGIRLPRSLQPGRGSWSAIFAHIVALEFDKLEIFSTTQYRWLSISNPEYDIGDSFSQEFKVAYRIVEEDYPGQSISPSLGIRYEVSTPTKIDGDDQPNSGARSLSLLPGMVWHAFAFNHDLGFGLDINIQFVVPVFQDVNGTQGVTQFEVQSSIAFRF